MILWRINNKHPIFARNDKAENFTLIITVNWQKDHCFIHFLSYDILILNHFYELNPKNNTIIILDSMVLVL